MTVQFVFTAEDAEESQRFTEELKNKRSEIMANAFAEETKKEVKKDVTSLRSALEWLDTQGDVMKTEVEVDPDLEITGVQKHLDGGPVVLFNKVKGKPHVRAITNLLADMNVVDKLFGYETPQERTRKIADAMTHPLTPMEVSQDEAPCQEEVSTDVPARHK